MSAIYRFTAETEFLSCNSKKENILRVAGGIPAEDALLEASLFLEAVESLSGTAAIELDGSDQPTKNEVMIIWASNFCAQIAKALVEAVIKGGENAH